MARLPRLFRTRSWVPRKKTPWLQIWDNLVWFSCFILKTVYCVYSLESPQWGDSNEYTQHTFMLKKIEKISHLSLLTWRYCQPSLARNFPSLELIFMVPKVFEPLKFYCTSLNIEIVFWYQVYRARSGTASPTLFLVSSDKLDIKRRLHGVLFYQAFLEDFNAYRASQSSEKQTPFCQYLPHRAVCSQLSSEIPFFKGPRKTSIRMWSWERVKVGRQVYVVAAYIGTLP